MAANTNTVSWWASVYSAEKGRRAALTTSDGETSVIKYVAESEYYDYKPITSPDGSMVAFFRVTNEADKETGDVSLWRSKICVMMIISGGLPTSYGPGTIWSALATELPILPSALSS